MTVANSIKAQIDEAKYVIRAQMARIAELEAENERLKAGLSAHDVLKQLYLNEALPSGTRLKAAAAALNVEVPRLESVPPALELTAEPVVPLAELVEQRRARQKLLEPPHRVLPDGHTVVLLKGNGSNSDDH